MRESPHRVNEVLTSIAKGHALLFDWHGLTMSDIPVVAKIAVSTGPYSRVVTLRALLEAGGRIKAAELAAGIKVSLPTARTYLKELARLGVGTLEHDPQETVQGDEATGWLNLDPALKWIIDYLR